jgi:hypothetical protein
MRRSLLLTAALFLFAVPTQAQLPTTLLDDFNRPDTVDVGTTPTTPTSLQWSESGEAVGSGSSLTQAQTVRINGNRLDLQAGQEAGVKIATVDMSNVSGYNTTLGDAGGVVTWAFNVRQSKSNPGGFGSTGSGGALFALAASGMDLDGTNAFAVALGDGDDTDALKLVNYNGGYSSNSDFDILLEGSTDRSNEYVSVKVTYDNSTSPDTWTLYALSDPGSFPVSDPRTLDGNDQVAQTQMDLSGTSNSRKIIGALWDHGATSANALFDDIYVTDPSAQLPVELSAFDATTSDRGVTLTWETAAETNNAGFEVQQKRSGSFETVGFVDGAGTTTQAQSYRFALSDLSAGRHTFRLRQVDLDGSSHLSPTRSVVVSSKRAGLRLRGANPVPAGQAVPVDVTTEQAQAVTVRLVDVLGRTVRTVHDGRVSGAASLSVGTQELSSGTYFLRATGASFTATETFTVVR